jgi:hypothetical protein
MEEVKLEKVIFEFTQDEHCMSNEMGGVESLTIECLSDFGIPCGGGGFFVLKTEQWAIDGTEDIVKLILKVKQAIDIVK